jgi:hypothetical protein
VVCEVPLFCVKYLGRRAVCSRSILAICKFEIAVQLSARRDTNNHPSVRVSSTAFS